MYKIMWSANIGSFTFFFMMWKAFISFSCIITLTGTFSNMLDRSGHPYFVFKEKYIYSFSIIYDGFFGWCLISGRGSSLLFLECWEKIILMLLLLLSRFSRVRLCATPETAAHQAPPSLGFSRQEYWSGLPFPSPMHESEKWKWSRSVVSDS